jgi:outer membrane protein
MRKNILGWVLLALGSIILVSATTTWAAGSPKIGVVDGMKMLEQSQWGKRANEEFKKQAEKMKADLEPKEKALLQAKEEFDKKKDVFDQKTRAKKEQELRDMYEDFQKQGTQANAKFEELRNGFFQKAREATQKIVEKIGKEDKYDYIFEKSAVLYVGSDKDDITQRVTVEFDKLPPFKP